MYEYALRYVISNHARGRGCVCILFFLKRVMYATDQEFLNGGQYRWNFSGNCPKAEVSFSQISIQFYIAGLRTKNFSNGFLILQKPVMVGMLGIAPVRKHSLAHRWVFPKQTAILKSSNIFVNRILAPRTHGS